MKRADRDACMFEVHLNKKSVEQIEKEILELEDKDRKLKQAGWVELRMSTAPRDSAPPSSINAAADMFKKHGHGFCHNVVLKELTELKSKTVCHGTAHHVAFDFIVDFVSPLDRKLQFRIGTEWQLGGLIAFDDTIVASAASTHWWSTTGAARALSTPTRFT